MDEKQNIDAENGWERRADDKYGEDIVNTAYEEAAEFSDIFGCDHVTRARLTHAFARVVSDERKRCATIIDAAANGHQAQMQECTKHLFRDGEKAHSAAAQALRYGAAAIREGDAS